MVPIPAAGVSLPLAFALTLAAPAFFASARSVPSSTGCIRGVTISVELRLGAPRVVAWFPQVEIIGERRVVESRSPCLDRH